MLSTGAHATAHGALGRSEQGPEVMKQHNYTVTGVAFSLAPSFILQSPAAREGFVLLQEDESRPQAQVA